MVVLEERTGLEVLDEEACWGLLRGGAVGRLAVAVGRQLDIFPVNYVVHAGGLLVRTAAGTKLAGAVLGRPVAFEVDHIDHERETGWSVVVRGRAREVERLEELLAAEDSGLRAWAEGPKDRFVVIVADEVTGRRILGPS